jgi:hypothetical protein
VNGRNKSELLFEGFCQHHGLDMSPIAIGPNPTPDYHVRFGEAVVFVEIKQIESEGGINRDGASSRIVGDHVRRKIVEARKQVQAASRAGYPTFLLIYNMVDEPFQSFGTERHDFIAAMYGEHTVRLSDGKVDGSFHGKRSELQRAKNTSFGAVGHLRRTSGGAEVTLFENAYARNAVPFDVLPKCFDVVRVEVESAA